MPSCHKFVKSHANDAYCIGKFQPRHRTKTKYYKKRRRNNRCLEKFYDAQYIDVRDGEKKPGGSLSCGRTNRKEPRNNSKNERIYRGEKKSAGHRSIRRKRYLIQPGTTFLYDGKKYVSTGVQHYGEYVTAKGLEKAVKTEKIKVLKHAGGWIEVDPLKEKAKKQLKPRQLLKH